MQNKHKVELFFHLLALLLTIILIILKLCGVIHWQWPIVLLPAILYYGIVIVTCIFISLAYFLLHISLNVVDSIYFYIKNRKKRD
jgi:hypothetical protein